MPETLNEALDKLERLRPEKLDEVSQRIRQDLGGAEWKMSICLLASSVGENCEPSSPREWKRQQALQASLEKRPTPPAKP